MNNTLRMLAGPPLGSIPVVINPNIPLVSERNLEDGTIERKDVLFCRMRDVNGRDEIHVHPDKWEEFQDNIIKVNGMLKTRGERP